MNFTEWLSTAQGLAFAVAAATVLLTLFLVARKAIGFFLTLLLLVFALTAGLTIANKELISDYLRGELTNDDAKSKEDFDQLKERMASSYQELKANFDVEKQKMAELLEKWHKDNGSAQADQEAYRKKELANEEKIKELEEKIKQLTERLEAKAADTKDKAAKPKSNIAAPITVPSATPIPTAEKPAETAIPSDKNPATTSATP